MIGTRVRTLLGEQDTDENGQPRTTLPGSVGVVTGHNHADHWDVTFPHNGAWVVLTEAEMADPAQYKLEASLTPVQKRLADERKVIRKLIRVAKAHGYALWRIWDGECNEYPKTEEEALDVVFGVDECWMRFKHPDQPKSHCAFIVLGNSAPEVIADCSVGEGWDAVMAEMNGYTDKMAEST